MANEIPTKSRQQVKARDMETCLMCGMSGNAWHHRRRRAVKSGHFQHCACNGVLLCSTDHAWVHAHPVEAMANGFILSTITKNPHEHPVRTFAGWFTLTCDGESIPCADPKEAP